MKSKSIASRRVFLKSLTAASAGAGMGIAFPAIVPNHVFGKRAPSNTIILGNIGLGWRGMQLMSDCLQNPNVRVAALGDCDRRFLVNAQNRLDDAYDTPRILVKDNRPIEPPKGAVDAYHDYRRVLDRKDIDAVVIAVPDHWHAKTSIEAVEAGKDIYGEKPLSLTINQGRAMVKATRANGRIYQVGSQQRSDATFRKACEYVRSGRLGKIDWIKAEIGGVDQVKPVPDEPVPAGLDWERWLGPAPFVPYNPLRCHIEFRWFFEYSGGKTTDWGAHHCDIAQWGIGMEYSGPRFVDGKGRTKRGAFNVFNSFEFTMTYDNGTELIVTSKGGNGVTFHGEKGEIFVARGGKIKSDPEDILKEPLRSGDVKLYASDNHFQNWVDCIRSRELPVADIEIGHRSATVCHIANICGRLKRRLEWDPEAEVFVNDNGANEMLDREERKGYEYKA